MHDNLRGQSTIGRSSVAHPGPFLISGAGTRLDGYYTMAFTWIGDLLRRICLKAAHELISQPGWGDDRIYN